MQLPTARVLIHSFFVWTKIERYLKVLTAEALLCIFFCPEQGLKKIGNFQPLGHAYIHYSGWARIEECTTSDIRGTSMYSTFSIWTYNSHTRTYNFRSGGAPNTPFSHSKPIYFRVESATTPSSYPTVVHPHLAKITAMTRNKKSHATMANINCRSAPRLFMSAMKVCLAFPSDSSIAAGLPLVSWSLLHLHLQTRLKVEQPTGF